MFQESREESKPQPIFVSTIEGRRLLGGIGNTKIHELIGTGKLQSALIGRSRKIVYDSLLEYAKSQIDQTKVNNAA